MVKIENKEKFPGFPPDWNNDFWMYPRMLEGYWYMLSGSEQKVLTFILRQIIGFHKNSDKISTSQFLRGIGEKNKGVGLAKGTVKSGIRGLVDKGFIWIKKTNNKTNEYGLVVQDLDRGVVQKLDKTGSNLEQGSGPKIEHTIDNNNRDFTKEEYIEKLFFFYRVMICPDARLTKKGRSRIAERLEEYSPDKLAEAIDNFSKNDWWMENHRGNGVEWFFSSEDQIDRFINLPLSQEKSGDELRRGTYNQEENRIE